MSDQIANTWHLNRSDPDHGHLPTITIWGNFVLNSAQAVSGLSLTLNKDTRAIRLFALLPSGNRRFTFVVDSEALPRWNKPQAIATAVRLVIVHTYQSIDSLIEAIAGVFDD